MNNRIALILALVIVASIVLDLALNEGEALLFLLRKMVDLVDYAAFWR